MPNNVFNMLASESAVIASGASISPSVNLGGLRLFGLVLPAAFTAASLTFQVSFDNGVSWMNMYDASGSEVCVTASTSRYIALDPSLYSAVCMIRLRSGTASAPVAQAQDTSITLVLRSI